MIENYKKLRQYIIDIETYVADLESQLSDKDKEIELYRAEMSAAKEAGFYSAQELFIAYQIQAPVVEARHKLHRKGPDCYSTGDGQGCPACALIAEYEKSEPNFTTHTDESPASLVETRHREDFRK